MSMLEWQTQLLEPDGLHDEAGYPAWFAAIARRLLCGCRLMVGSEPYRFTEIEFYYYGRSHQDPFTHRDPIQKGTGLWYFHRTAGVYRGGSFKGFDLTFGGKDVFGGVLIRGLESLDDHTLVDGPSLSVDHLLARTEAADVATLDGAIEARPCWDADSPLHLEWLPAPAERTLLRTARVGLSLKRLRRSEAPPRFIMRRYRYLSEPRRIAKGKMHMVLGLHMDGKTKTDIREITGCTKGALERYIDDFEEGRKETDLKPYFGIDLGPKELARLHGLCSAKYGAL